MITVLPSAPFYNIFFNGLLKYQVMGEEHYCKLEECRYHISGTSVLFECLHITATSLSADSLSLIPRVESPSMVALAFDAYHK